MRKVINVVLIIFILLCIGLLIYSGYHILNWNKSNKQIDAQVNQIEESSEVEELEVDPPQTEIVNPVKKSNVSNSNNVNREDPYWDYIKMKFINVDLTKLKKINDETIGWIKVNGTNINYPFVQHKDNKYYLTHQFDKKVNSAGWVFMDFRNNPVEFDDNTIIYAHGRLNNTMFGSLRNVVKSSWYSNTQNYVVKISTEYENTLWQVFSTYRIKTTDDYLQVDFSSDEEYVEFLDMIKKRSVHDYNVDLSKDDKIITLSTCHNDTDKVVLHARLIKRSKKK